MFKKTKALTLFLLLLLISISAFYIEKEASPIQKNTDSPQFTEKTQQRWNVCKEIWLADQTRRSYARLTSSSSTLILTKQDNSYKLLESMQDIRCAMEDWSNPEGKQIRYFTAQEGNFDYSTQTFCTEKAFVAFFRSAECLMTFHPEEAFLRGIAKDVIFSFSKSPHFQAKHFKALMRSEK